MRKISSMSLQRLNDSYLGNPNVKRDGIIQEWTQDTVIEYAQCMKDPIYFTEKYCKVISLDPPSFLLKILVFLK